MPDSVISASRCGISCRKRVAVLLGAVAHHPLDARAVVPAAVEDQHLAGGGQLLDVALHVELGLLAVGRRRQRDDAEHPRADPLGQALDHPALAGGVAALEEDDDAGAARLHPGLQVGDLDLQAGELGLVGLVAGLLRVGGGGCGGRLGVLCLLVLLGHGVPPFGLVASKARSASSRSSKIMSGPMAASSPARSSRPRTSAWSSASAEGRCRGRRGRRAPPRASRRRSKSTWVMALASRTSQRVPGGIASAMACSRAWTWSALKNSRSPWISAMVEAGHRPGVGAAVQLVEAVAAGNAAEQRVARVHHLVQQVGEGRADRDEDAVQHPEADRREERDHREDELHAADPPDFAERRDVDQAEGGGDQDGAERRDRQDGERRLQVEDDQRPAWPRRRRSRAASGRRRWH